METVCIIVGVSLIAAGLAMFLIPQPNWKDEGELVEHHRVAIERWSKVQRYVRKGNNTLIVLIGVLIYASAFMERNRTWGYLWLAILGLVMLCIVLAMIDAMSSLAGYKRALPEAARRSFSDPSRKDAAPSQSQFPEQLPE